MHGARKITIPESFLDLALRADNPIPDIRTKNVVTSIWLGPSFAMYMSDKCAFSSIRDDGEFSAPLITSRVVASEHVKIALRAPNAESGQEAGWYAEGNVGLNQFGSPVDGDYLPLFQLQMIRKRNRRPRRDGRDPNEIM